MSTLAHDASGDFQAEVFQTTPPGSTPPAPASGAPARPLTTDELKTLPLQALLVRCGAITIDQLAEALRANVATGRSVEEAAIERGWVTQEFVAQLIAAKQRATGETAAVPAARAPVAAAPAPTPTPAPAPAAAPVPPAPAPQPPVQHVRPAPAPAPTIEIGEDPQIAAADGSVAVFVNLADGERVFVGRYASEADAEQRALEVVEQFVRPTPGVWPRIRGRFVRPEAVVSIELSAREPS